VSSKAGAAGPDAAEAELLEAIHPVSRETLERFQRYRVLLDRWQAKTNLVSPSTLRQFWSRHVADSLQVLALHPQCRDWADFGSGGGFPGLAIAIALAGETSSRHRLVESSAKKCAFLREVARETGARATVIQERIESVAQRISADPPQILTARALAHLRDLMGLSRPLLAAGSVAIFHKGRDFEREIEECDGLPGYDLVVHPDRVEPGAALLEIRDPAARTLLANGS
jgi:16S rRNA (guanine527-N7)-methyltransferase